MHIRVAMHTCSSIEILTGLRHRATSTIDNLASYVVRTYRYLDFNVCGYSYMYMCIYMSLLYLPYTISIPHVLAHYNDYIWSYVGKYIATTLLTICSLMTMSPPGRACGLIEVFVTFDIYILAVNNESKLPEIAVILYSSHNSVPGSLFAG